jgi:hypothetical protein
VRIKLSETLSGHNHYFSHSHPMFIFMYDKCIFQRLEIDDLDKMFSISLRSDHLERSLFAKMPEVFLQSLDGRPGLCVQ